MEILIKSARIIDLNSRFHNKKLDVLLKDGQIKRIDKNIRATSGYKVYDQKNLHLY
ncbi:MAG: hypothetical protein IH948_07100 [Bacteroidetes bacterium]|nr:hypothetical protein [Bacteroidota bacterium]